MSTRTGGTVDIGVLWTRRLGMPDGPFGSGSNPLEDLVSRLVGGLEQSLGWLTKPATSTQRVDRYGRDLTAEARAGRLDPVIGREDEIEQILEVLSRR
ncbi:MAG TPA: hypothetical protein VHH53_07455, partial [Pseudonocardiaceae bacterium]|nr:hypothetical protein [Pseudonocardiaceae bacterium]